MEGKEKHELWTSTALQPYANMEKAIEVYTDIKSRVESQRLLAANIYKVPATPAAKPGLKYNSLYSFGYFMYSQDGSMYAMASIHYHQGEVSPVVPLRNWMFDQTGQCHYLAR